MKKIIFTIFLLSLALTTFAQEGFKIGFRASPIIAFGTVVDSTKESIVGLDRSARMGFSYGLLANYGFTDNYAFHTGVHIVYKGYNSTDAAGATQNVRVTAIEIPLALKLRSPEIGEGIHIKGLFGVSMDINTGYKNTYTGMHPFTGAVGSGTIRDTDFINLFTTTFIIGPGVEWVFDWGMLDLGATFHQGLLNINTKQAGSNITKLSYVAIDLGYYF